MKIKAHQTFFYPNLLNKEGESLSVQDIQCFAKDAIFEDIVRTWLSVKRNHKESLSRTVRTDIWAAAAWDFQQCDILTCVDSDEPVQPPLKLRNSKYCSVNSLTLIEYSSDKQSLWSDCAYAQAGLSLCWSHIQHCWKSHALAHFILAH